MICWTRALQISNYFSISCCQGMENLGLHEEVQKELPDFIQIAHDGLVLKV